MKNINKITTERLILRKFNKNDLDDFSVIIGKDEIGKQLPKGEGYTRKEAEKWLENIKNIWEDKNYGTWAVIKKETGDLIGHCGLNPVDELDEIEVLYAIDPVYWGKGYATEAASKTVDYGLEVIGLDNIIGLTKIGNRASERVLEKSGLIYIKEIDIFDMRCKLFELQK